MNPKYIVFEQADERTRGAVCYIGNQPHQVVWDYLHRQNSDVFYRTISAGYTYFKAKTKKFVATGDCSTLSLTSHEDDHQVLQDALGHNGKLKLFVTDFNKGPDFGFLLGTSDVLLATYFDQASIFGEGKATFRIQDSARPFKFAVQDVKGTVVDPQYLEYIEDRLFG